MKFTLYGVVVLCFIVAGVLDAADHQWKAASVAWVFALANALIFFWRP